MQPAKMSGAGRVKVSGALDARACGHNERRPAAGARHAQHDDIIIVY